MSYLVVAVVTTSTGSAGIQVVWVFRPAAVVGIMQICRLVGAPNAAAYWSSIGYIPVA